eukprot:272743_1
MSTLIISVVIISCFVVTNVNAFYCCICGQQPSGGCYEPQAPSDRVFIEDTSMANGDQFTCGYDYTSLLSSGPCGVAQANAFSSDPGCDCPVDDRPVKATPACSTCGADEIQDVFDENGNVEWFHFSIGALSCKDAFNYAKDGYVPQTLCDRTKNEIVSNGCCGTIEAAAASTDGATNERDERGGSRGGCRGGSRGCRFTMDDDVDNVSPGNSTTVLWIVLAAVVIALVIGSGLVFFVRNKKKNRRFNNVADKLEVEDEEQEDEEEEEIEEVEVVFEVDVETALAIRTETL